MRWGYGGIERYDCCTGISTSHNKKVVWWRAVTNSVSGGCPALVQEVSGNTQSQPWDWLTGWWTCSTALSFVKFCAMLCYCTVWQSSGWFYCSNFERTQPRWCLFAIYQVLYWGREVDLDPEIKHSVWLLFQPYGLLNFKPSHGAWTISLWHPRNCPRARRVSIIIAGSYIELSFADCRMTYRPLYDLSRYFVCNIQCTPYFVLKSPHQQSSLCNTRN